MKVFLPLLTALSLGAFSAPAQELARVVRVVDADTYDLLLVGGRERVRLLGVDAPERDQAFGALATDSVGRLLWPGRLVSVARAGVDRYGRTLAAVWLPAASGRVALDSVLVVRGWAWAYAPAGQRVRWAAEQARAQAYGRGLWRCGTADPVPPRIWRSFNYKIKRLYQGRCTW